MMHRLEGLQGLLFRGARRGGSVGSNRRWHWRHWRSVRLPAAPECTALHWGDVRPRRRGCHHSLHRTGAAQLEVAEAVLDALGGGRREAASTRAAGAAAAFALLLPAASLLPTRHLPLSPGHLRLALRDPCLAVVKGLLSLLHFLTVRPKLLEGELRQPLLEVVDLLHKLVPREAADRGQGGGGHLCVFKRACGCAHKARAPGCRCTA
mmetsp:Transcript_165848/g.532508  ORF Transcript_165848/g.532508 Transcript_165848/m.532508 type:complete len:208 (-) Transcript_165848:2-625(-)